MQRLCADNWDIPPSVRKNIVCERFSGSPLSVRKILCVSGSLVAQRGIV